MGTMVQGKEPIDLMDQHRFYIIDDLHLAADETFLFHFYNLIQERRFYCLFTSVFSPARWSFKLPDLKSRLSSIVSIPIQKPDDDLLSDLAMKQFIEKGLKVHHKTVDYMLAHIERSFSAIRYAINLIDKI